MNEGTDHQPAEQRRIAHLDMDAFFAAVEQLDEPRYRGKAVIVGGLGPRGVVSTASYEARKFGVGSALPMARARKLCPQGIFLPPRFSRYVEISKLVLGIIGEYAQVVEKVSIDEAFFDLTLRSDAEKVVAIIKERVKKETGLTCSVGLAPNRFLAKVASELEKPDGLVVINREDVQEILDPLPVRMIWGVGKATERRLGGLGISLVRDLRRASLQQLTREFGSVGRLLYCLARGEDDTPLNRKSKTRSISREVTFAQDVYSTRRMEEVVQDLARSVSAQLREGRFIAKTVRIKIRFADFETITRQASLVTGTDSTDIVKGMALDLLRRRVDISGRGVRLIGVGAGRLCKVDARQLSLFSEYEAIPMSS